MSEHESEVISDSQGGNRKLWVTAKEVAGLEGMPTTDRRTRDILDEWAKGKEGARRKRSGTKAFEYHVSVLPKAVRDQVSPPNQGTVATWAPGSGAAGAVAGWPIAAVGGVPLLGAAVVVGSAAGGLGKLFDSDSCIAEESMSYKAKKHDNAVELRFFIEEPELFLNEMGGTFPVSSKWLKWRGFEPNDLAFFVQNGDSMAQRIKHRDTVIINSRDNRLADGSLMVVEVDGAALIRNVQKIPGGWSLNCENPRYEPITLPVDADEACKVIGRVVRIINET
ncbi:helix-turn-helix domain-containing protein [Aeromonas media]|uniref:helix-turn-helix domain-containing protein n=1 Tax=Aeromonas media TaxID=651 RepID=UPI00224049BC|nr:S24 family peptidase [Aeromonas media]